jgi:transaldolase
MSTVPTDWTLNKLRQGALDNEHPLAATQSGGARALLQPRHANRSLVFLLDVDNTLLDNDRFAEDLSARLQQAFGSAGHDHYWSIYTALRDRLGYADYLGALQAFRDGRDDDPALLWMSAFLLDYPFAQRLYPRALEAIAHLQTMGLAVMLSDGDMVFQPRKVQRSGIWDAVGGEVLIELHKEHALAAVQRRYPAAHYVMVDDKPQLLAAMKQVLGAQLTTVFVRQGHYALEALAGTLDPPPDRCIERIGELIDFELPHFLAAVPMRTAAPDPQHISSGAGMNTTQQLHDLGQSLWLDNITRTLLDDGSLSRIIKTFSVTGLTSNPTIFNEAISNSEAYDEGIREKTRAGKSGEALFVELALEDLRRAAVLFRSIFDATDQVDGWVSMEVSPLLAQDTAGSIAAARQIHAQANRPNLFVKIPGTPEGIPAIEESIFAGVPINVTLLFSREQYLAAAEAYLRGIERRIDAGLDPQIASVASLFVSRWDKAVSDKVPAELRNRLGIAIGQKTYRAYRELLGSKRWRKLAAAGAGPQRLLWASTGVKDPLARDTLYVEAFAAPDTINTMPEKTLRAYANHGEFKGPMSADGGDAEAALTHFARAGIDVDALALQLQREGAQAFVKSWKELLKRIADKSAALGGSVKVGV